VRDETVSRNYAETLFELARRNEAMEEYGSGLAVVARQLDEEPRFRMFLETPRIDDGDRKALIRKVFGDSLPTLVLNFVLVTIDKRRQRLLRSISREYQALLDEHLGREHVEVTLARTPDDATQAVIAALLSSALGKKAIPHIRVKPVRKRTPAFRFRAHPASGPEFESRYTRRSAPLLLRRAADRPRP
jgi:F-type H+-transporting ATPase subunit delta